MIYAFILNEVMTARLRECRRTRGSETETRKQRQAGRQTNKPLPDKTDCQAIRAANKHSHTNTEKEGREREEEERGRDARVQANTLSSCGRD